MTNGKFHTKNTEQTELEMPGTDYFHWNRFDSLCLVSYSVSVPRIFFSRGMQAMTYECINNMTLFIMLILFHFAPLLFLNSTCNALLIAICWRRLFFYIFVVVVVVCCLFIFGFHSLSSRMVKTAYHGSM